MSRQCDCLLCGRTWCTGATKVCCDLPYSSFFRKLYSELLSFTSFSRNSAEVRKQNPRKWLCKYITYFWYTINFIDYYIVICHVLIYFFALEIRLKRFFLKWFAPNFWEILLFCRAFTEGSFLKVKKKLNASSDLETDIRIVLFFSETTSLSLIQ